MIVAVLLVILFSLISKTELIKIIASVCGVVYVLTLAKEKRISQIFGFINTVIYAWLMFKDKVYGSAIYNGLYCLPMLIYTYINWGKDNKENKKVQVKSYSIKTRCYLIIAAIAIITLYYMIAIKIGVNYALVDAITITCGAFGMYAISKKQIEQWYAFIIVNIANISMWLAETVKDTSNITMVLMFIIYMINNIYGLTQWKKTINNK
jgi:nicotinamide mononucleotide transporter